MLSPLRSGLLAWCEGLDQMASQHRAVGPMGRQYVESPYISLWFFFLCLPGCKISLWGAAGWFWQHIKEIQIDTK